MTRTTNSIPADLHAEIKRMQRNEPKLSVQEGLIRLARKGFFNTSVDELASALESINRIDVDRDPDITFAELERHLTAQKRYLLQLIMLTRHLLVEHFGEKGRGIIEKVKNGLPE